MSKWRKIETAPKDGTPIWVRGFDFGNPKGQKHYGWVHWDGERWLWAGCTDGIASHITHWLPLTALSIPAYKEPPKENE